MLAGIRRNARGNLWSETRAAHRSAGGIVAFAIFAFLALVWGTLELAIGQGDPTTALLLPLTGLGVALFVFRPDLSMAYLCVVMPLLITLNRHGGTWGPGRLAAYALVAVSLIAAGLTWIRERPSRTHLAAAGLTLACFVVYLAGHIVGAGDRAAAAESFVNYVYVWPFLVMPVVLLRKRGQLRGVMLFVAGLGTGLAVLSVGVSLLTTNPSQLFLHTGRFNRVHLYFGTANSLGVFLSISLFVLLYGVQPRVRWMRWLKLVGQFAILFAILLTFSRRTWLATGLLLIVHCVVKRDWRSLAIVSVVAGTLSVQLFQDVGERAESTVDMGDSSNRERERELSKQLRFLVAEGISWTGWGMENATYATSHRRSGRVYLHNFYLTLYYLAGTIGLLFYLALNFLLLRGLNHARRRARAPDARGAAAAGMAVTAVVLLTGLFGMGNVTFPMNYFAALVPGLGFAAFAIERAEERAKAAAALAEEPDPSLPSVPR